MIDVHELNLSEIEDIFYELNEPKYRASQLIEWVYKGVDISDITVFSKQLKDKLKEKIYIGKLDIEKKNVSKDKQTVKYLFKLKDGNFIESVVIHYKFGYTQCVSTQVGCRMGCAFCASTENGMVRNLTSGEMLEEILSSQKDLNQRISRVVLMGSGEPLDNFNEVMKFIYKINSEKGLNIGQRHITLSTCGIAPGIIKFADKDTDVNLSVSLHAPTNEKRSEIMPINKKYKIEDIIGACKYYISRTNRRITFEYALIKGVNDSVYDGIELARLIGGMLCHVNLIPINSVDNKFERPNDDKINEFAGVLRSRGIQTTVRRELGSDINAACGQLRRGFIK